MNDVCGCRIVALLALSVLVAAPAMAVERADSTGDFGPFAREVLGSAPTSGVCVFVAPRSPVLPLALARNGAQVVHCLEGDASACDSLRKAIREAGLYGQVSVTAWSPPYLPHVDDLVNVIVVPDWPAAARAGLTVKEVLRAVAPLGTAWLGGAVDAREVSAQAKATGAGTQTVDAKTGQAWLKLSKPWPADIDQWGHYLHGPDGNPVARDLRVGPPRHYQWISDPVWSRSHETDSTPSTLVTAGGRILSIQDAAPISLAGQNDLPDKWSLVCQDAFNGVVLWQVPIRRWGWREWKHTWFNTRPGDIPLNIQKRLVAAGEFVYVTLGYRAPVSQLDARTGAVLQTYAGTEGANEILFLDGRLIISVVEGERLRVKAVDAASGKVLWTSDKTYAGTTTDYIRWKEMHGGSAPERLDPAANLAADGRIAVLIDASQIAALDLATGQEKWKADFPLDAADRTAGGMQNFRNHLWVGAMIVTDGVVVHASPSKLAALSADTGKLLWEQPKKFIQHLWYEWKDVFVIDGLVWTWSAELDRKPLTGGTKKQGGTLAPRWANGYDLHTGERKKQVEVGEVFTTHHHHRCYRDKATVRYILASRRGTEFVSLEGGKHVVDNWVRGTCHVGMMPANGLQYAPPHPCQCYIDEKLNGFNALTAERESARRPAAGPRLTTGPAMGKIKAEPEGLDDWPTLRHDAMRTGSTPAALSGELKPLWTVRPGVKVSAPVVAGGRVYAALVDEHHVICLDAADGRQLWEFAADGRVDSPPTIHKGLVLFGSVDGYVYCLRAADGALAWRLRAGTGDRLISAMGQLESPWPIHGSILVQGDVAYAAAGRSSHLDGGIVLLALDPATGKVLREKTLSGPEYVDGTFKQNFNLPMGYLNDVLVGDGANSVYMRTAAFDDKLSPVRSQPTMKIVSGILDGTYFKRVPWVLGKDYARLIVHDQRRACYVRMFDSLQGLNSEVYFVPGKKGYLLLARDKDSKAAAPAWSKRIAVRARTMVLAGERLVLAGPPDEIDPADPLGSFEGRRGGLLHVYDSTSGERLAEVKLHSPPVLHGAALASGRLVLVLEDGSIVCRGR